MSKRTKVTFSLILVICLFLSGLPSADPVSAAEMNKTLNVSITESTATEPQAVTKQAAVTEEIPVLQLDEDCQILNHVDPEVFAAGNHIARLPEQETLSSYVFLNADGSQTVYYMDQPVKFEKTDGTVVEKNLTLTAATEGYTTTQNDIQLTIPTNPTNGIRLVYDNHQITLIPQGGTLANAAQATDNSVTYLDYYGEGMSLRYTPTLSGVKEDILLNAYSGVNSFTFRLNTGGLNLYQANGRYYLAESKAATERIELGEVVTYDAKSKFSIGTITAQPIMPGQAYMLTLTVDEAFLTDENTAYPVTIDPTLTVSYGNNGDNYIIDAPIFEGYPNYNYGAFQYNRVGYVDSSYQSGRTVVALPVLTSSSIYTSLAAENITSVKFYVKEATGTSGISVRLYPLVSLTTWTESTVTWSNVGARDSVVMDTQTLTDSAWSAFNITELVKKWKTGFYSGTQSFVMIGANEDSIDKSFCSSEHQKNSYRPYVVMTYNSNITLNKTTADVDKGSTLMLTATTFPAGEAVTWSSSNTSVATVSGNGEVTGVELGSATITAKTLDGTSASCLVNVTIADGVYRIKSSCGLYLGTYGSTAENTSARLLAYSNSGLSELYQLWKITYIGNAYYSIRPLHKLSMGLHATSNNVDITTTNGPNNTLNDVISYSRWGISATGDEGVYYINNIGISSMAMRYANGATSPGIGVVTANNSDSLSSFRWSLISTDVRIVNLDIMFDVAYLNRYPNAVNRISNQATSLLEKYWEEFRICVNCSLPSNFTSFADSECSTVPDQLCLHADNEMCHNSVAWTNGNVDLQTYHHNNIYNIQLRVPFPDTTQTFRMVYIGHNICASVTDSGDLDNDGSTSDTIHATNPYFGLTFPGLGLISITNTKSELSEAKTMVHEFGHLYRAPDHYGGSQYSTNEIEALTGYDFDEYCIYGEKKDDEYVMENLIICEGCKAYIEENKDLYDHN